MGDVRHAPSPWAVQPFVDAIDILDADGVPVAHLADRNTQLQGMPPENARLIAAAPDLLTACKECLNVFEALLGTLPTGESIAANRELAFLHAAIAKAKAGRTPSTTREG